MRRGFVGEHALCSFQRFLESPSPDFSIDELGHQCASPTFPDHAVQLRGEFFRNYDMHAAAHKPTIMLTREWAFARENDGQNGAVRHDYCFCSARVSISAPRLFAISNSAIT